MIYVEHSKSAMLDCFDYDSWCKLRYCVHFFHNHLIMRSALSKMEVVSIRHQGGVRHQSRIVNPKLLFSVLASSVCTRICAPLYCITVLLIDSPVMIGNKFVLVCWILVRANELALLQIIKSPEQISSFKWEILFFILICRLGEIDFLPTSSVLECYV